MSSAPAATEHWFRRFRPATEIRMRLICLPHAGGTAGSYRKWAQWMPPDIEVLAVRYPGREDRIAESCAATMEELVSGVFGAVEPLLDRPVAFFGHSMGAWASYELALRVAAVPGVDLRTLFVSGQVPPHRMRRDRTRLCSDDEIVETVRGLGSAGAMAYTHPILRELVLPALRADFGLLDAYRPLHGHLVDVPIVAYGGVDDLGVSLADLAAWADITHVGAQRRSFPGGHFYLEDDIIARSLVADIATHLAGELNGAGVDHPAVGVGRATAV